MAVVACSESNNKATTGEANRSLVRGIGGDPESQDPGLAEDVHAFAVLIDTFEGLVTEDAAGQNALIFFTGGRHSASNSRMVFVFMAPALIAFVRRR